MSPASPRDWSGLLYLPGEDLVRSTIDGDDADWSESLSYVPPDSLVRTVLDTSRRERPTFALPATLLPSHTPFGAPHPARRTAAMLAALGLSPFSLAAATVFHAAFLFVVGPWIVTQATAARSIRPPRPPLIVATRLVYAPRSISHSPTAAAPKTRSRGDKQPPVDTTNSGRTTTTLKLQLDSSRSLLSQQPPRAAMEREAANALSQEIFFAGDGFEPELRDRPKITVILGVLRRWPGARLRVLGAAPRRRVEGPPPGTAEAEAVKRLLVQEGIDADRIEIGQIPEEERRCPEREPNCAAARRRVRTTVAAPR